MFSLTEGTVDSLNVEVNRNICHAASDLTVENNRSVAIETRL